VRVGDEKLIITSVTVSGSLSAVNSFIMFSQLQNTQKTDTSAAMWAHMAWKERFSLRHIR